MPQTPNLSWIEVNRTALRYQLLPADRAAAPVLVLVHEMGGSLESWDDLCATLAGELTLLRYDTRCAGLSEKISGELAIDDHVADLTALLDALHIDTPVALMGVAVGAAIAIRFAACYPERCQQLIGLAPACGVAATAREATRQRAAALRSEGLGELVPALLDKTWPEPLRTDEEVFEAFRLRWRAADPQGFAATFAMLAGLELEADLPRLPARTLLVAGEYDALRPPAEIERLAGFATQIEPLQVASGHFMPLQSPRLVAALVRGYVCNGLSGAAIYREFIEQPQHRVGASRHAA
ncbi:3-oxoadipate enol-lactonase [Pseudomonas nitritireducens]|uniref:3-oxoadipate enol-lactonase n=1 Tax=Pseudomonas nitroreducens TaxID=46680 RepID=A0A7W7P5P0_PSENT|nr:alpha/beta fold hydrolase [Pseudomonas nitritireducens]MBB4868174.1 3-oxoadipate enol-lactonase [Pseudomonas nitritireducens]